MPPSSKTPGADSPLPPLHTRPTPLPPPPGVNSWSFLSWLLDDRRLKFYEQAAAFALFVRGVSIAINVISATKFVKFIAKKRAKKNTRQNMWERLTKAP